MTRPLIITCCVAPLLLASCSRHFVVERDEGRVDGARSIATNSDTAWTIHTEPAYSDEQDAQERLRTLKRLLDEGLISPEDYEARKTSILEGP